MATQPFANGKMSRINYQLDDESLRLRAGRRISVLEVAFWIAGISISLATPYWFGLSSLLIFFYGTFCALTWRLSKAMPFTPAVLISLTIAIVVTSIMVAVLQNCSYAAITEQPQGRFTIATTAVFAETCTFSETRRKTTVIWESGNRSKTHTFIGIFGLGRFAAKPPIVLVTGQLSRNRPFSGKINSRIEDPQKSRS